MALDTRRIISLLKKDFSPFLMGQSSEKQRTPGIFK